jgi:hypothetical protein
MKLTLANYSQAAKANEVLCNCNFILLLQILYQLCQYWVAYATSVAACNAADDVFRAASVEQERASVERERAIKHKESCMKVYKDFEVCVERLAWLATIPPEQIPGKKP